MKRIITKKEVPITNLVDFNGRFNSKAIGYVYAYKKWWQCRYRFCVKVYMPYLKEPFYDCEHTTNGRIYSIEIEFAAKMEEIKDKIERRYSRFLKSRRNNKSRA